MRLNYKLTTASWIGGRTTAACWIGGLTFLQYILEGPLVGVLATLSRA